MNERGITPLIIVAIIVIIAIAVGYALISGGRGPSENENQGMWLRMIQSTDANSLDVDRTKMDQAMQVIALTQDTLMTFDWNMNYIPLLAESWEIGENGAYIDWHLRKGVKFHCGHPLDANAVAHSILRAKQPWSVQSDTVRNILDVEVLEPYTVRVHLAKWDRWLYDWFAQTSSSIVCPVCSEDPGYGISKFCGTGPFKVKEWVRDTRTILVRNDDYTWGPAIYQNRGPAHLSGITIEIDANNLTAEEKFFSGKVDLMVGISPRPALIERLQTDPSVFENFIYPRSSMAWIGFNVASVSPEIQQGLKSGRPIPPNHPISPVNDDRPWIEIDGKMTPDNANKGLLVRRALLYATNKQELLQAAWQGLGKIAYGPLTSLMWGYNPAVENMYPYDLEMARNLLAQAGYPGGSPENIVLHLTVYTTTYEPYVKECETLKDQWKQIGVDLEISTRAFDDIESIVARCEHDLVVGGYTWPNADMLWWYWHTVRVPPSPNRFWWGNAYTDEVIDNTFSYDDNLAFKAIQEAQILIMEDACYLPIVERPFLMPMKVYVKGFRVHPMSNFIWKHLDTYIEK
jgi:peptide/nickel transport system substrate-binding protein